MQKMKWIFLSSQLVAALHCSSALANEPPTINATVLPLGVGSTALMLEHDNLLLNGQASPIGNFATIPLRSEPISGGNKASDHKGSESIREGSAGTGQANNNWGYAELLDHCGMYDIQVYQYIDNNSVLVLSGIILDDGDQC